MSGISNHPFRRRGDRVGLCRRLKPGAPDRPTGRAVFDFFPRKTFRRPGGYGKSLRWHAAEIVIKRTLSNWALRSSRSKGRDGVNPRRSPSRFEPCSPSGKCTERGRSADFGVHVGLEALPKAGAGYQGQERWPRQQTAPASVGRDSDRDRDSSAADLNSLLGKEDVPAPRSGQP